MFFGLSMRQFIFSILAMGVAVVLYFVLRPYVGTETVSWMYILGAAPFAAMGFITYHGMTAEQFLWKIVILQSVNSFIDTVLAKDIVDVGLNSCIQQHFDCV